MAHCADDLQLDPFQKKESFLHLKLKKLSNCPPKTCCHPLTIPWEVLFNKIYISWSEMHWKVKTDETIVEKECPYVYQTSRFEKIAYIIGDLPTGDYYIHLAEIIFTNSLSGMWGFNAFIQEHKSISELDIYAWVGSNTPLFLMDTLTHVIDGGTLTLKFEAVTSSLIVCASYIRKGILFLDFPPVP